MDSDSHLFDHLFKILLIGATGAGKSCFILRYADNKFTDKFVTTIGIDFRVKTIQRGGYKIKLQIWDTAGQERFRSVSTSYFRGALGFLLLFDLSKDSSLADLSDWLDRIETNAHENPQVVLVGNKKDLLDNNNHDNNNNNKATADERQLHLSANAVSTESLDSMSSTSTMAPNALARIIEERKLTYITASGKTGENVDKAFEMLIDAILEKRIQELENRPYSVNSGTISDPGPAGSIVKKHSIFIEDETPNRICYC